MKKRPKVLCFVDYYLPGYKAGGPIRSIENMVALLGDKFEFMVVSRDHDLLENEKFPDIIIDDWNNFATHKIFYCSKKTLRFKELYKLINNTPHDVLYLNSFFSVWFSVLPLIIHHFCNMSTDESSVIIAPRGEFSAGALNLKKFRKSIFMLIAGYLGVYKKIIWQSSSAIEKNEIYQSLSKIRVSGKIFIGPDLVFPPIKNPSDPATFTNSEILKIIFLSRISPIKNLEFLLKALHETTSTIKLSVYGPIVDERYWRHCQSLIKGLPNNVEVSIMGEIIHQRVREAFSVHDVFAFPTKGENFGHVIYESLAVGTPVIISPNTSWLPDSSGALTVLSLEEPARWAQELDRRASTIRANRLSAKEKCLRYADNYFRKNGPLTQNIELFLYALSRKSSICIDGFKQGNS